MATQPRLVNKQFNSPIGLYSEANVREVLERDTQILANGAVGVNFYNPGVGKPASLQNSAVLRMLEEEEHRQRNGHAASADFLPRPLRESVKWPPPEYEIKHHQRASFRDVVIPGAKRVAWPPPPESGENNPEQASLPSQGVPPQPPIVVQKPVPTYKQPTTTPLKPLNISTSSQVIGNQSPNLYQSPASPNLNQSPVAFRPSTPSINKPWAPVQSPTHPNQFHIPIYQQSTQQYQPVVAKTYQPTPEYPQTVPQPYQSANQLYNQPVAVPIQVAQRSRPLEPPPSTIVLRQQAPVSQAPPPVFTSQPATATLKGGKKLRGDMKWPPENVKSQMEEENRQRIELTKGPAFRPRKVHRDYSNFFAQHALNSSYPGYKVPPGTQYFKPM